MNPEGAATIASPDTQLPRRDSTVYPFPDALHGHRLCV